MCVDTGDPDIDPWWALVNTVMNLRDLWNAGNFWGDWATSGFSSFRISYSVNEWQSSHFVLAVEVPAFLPAVVSSGPTGVSQAKAHFTDGSYHVVITTDITKRRVSKLEENLWKYVRRVVPLYLRSEVKNYPHSCFSSLWVWNLVSDIKGGT
jgi:hypothetical protein